MGYLAQHQHKEFKIVFGPMQHIADAGIPLAHESKCQRLERGKFSRRCAGQFLLHGVGNDWNALPGVMMVVKDLIADTDTIVVFQNLLDGYMDVW